MRKACVIGWPVEHSRSPLIHGHWIKAYGVDNASYDRFPVRPGELAAAFNRLRDEGFVGGNVTVPHKEEAFHLSDSLDDSAAALGAVNTLVVRDGRIEGRNTDGYGFLANLRETIPTWRPDAGPAVILGAGGAARPIVNALHSAGVPEIRLTNRSPDRAEALLRDLGVSGQTCNWADREALFSEAALLVNTTSLGMTGSPPLELSLAALPSSAIVYDIVYAPLETRLLADARERGLAAIDGLGMLLHQAAPGFEAWFGVRPRVTPELRELVVADLTGVA